jgi:hypothetical protein
MLPGIWPNWLTSCLSDEQQSKCKCLRESGGEQFVKVSLRIARSFRVCVKHISKFLPHLQERVTFIALLMEFSQPVTDDSANQARRMGHQRSKVLGISRDWFLSRACGKHFDQTQQGTSVVFRNRAIGARIILVRTKSPLRHYHAIAEFVIATEEMKFKEITGAPAGQLFESRELTLIMLPPPGRIGRLGGCLELNECASRCARPYECYVRSADAWIQVFGHYGQRRRGRNEGKNSLKQLLKRRGQRRLWNVRIRATKFSDTLSVCLQELDHTHASRESSRRA